MFPAPIDTVGVGGIGLMVITTGVDCEAHRLLLAVTYRVSVAVTLGVKGDPVPIGRVKPGSAYQLKVPVPFNVIGLNDWPWQ